MELFVSGIGAEGLLLSDAADIVPVTAIIHHFIADERVVVEVEAEVTAVVPGELYYFVLCVFINPFVGHLAAAGFQNRLSGCAG